MSYQYIFGSRAEAQSNDVLTVRGESENPCGAPSSFDRVFAGLVLVVFAPLLIGLTLLILLGGQTPFFLQERVGYRARTFRIFKFRTLPAGEGGWKAAAARAEGSPIATLRLALFRQVSKVLRATGLDELPQFANILRGDMQIIGPRPLMEKDYWALPARRQERCAVLPGITGLAQINGGQHLDADSKLALDLYLIAHSSRGIAAKIVMRTVSRILGFTSATAEVCKADLELARAHMEETRRTARLEPVAKDPETVQAVTATRSPLPTVRRVRMVRAAVRAAAIPRQQDLKAASRPTL